MYNENKQIIFNEVDSEKVLSNLLEIIKAEENNASILQTEIDNLEAEIDNLKKTREKEEKRINKSYVYFSPSSINQSELYDKKLQDSLNILNGKIEEHSNNHIKKIEQINKLNSIKEFIINKSKNEEILEFNKNCNEIGIKILENKERERSRIAGDLHDSTVQSLTNLVHRTELCVKLLDIDVIRAKLELAGMTTSLRTIINDMRDIIYDLRPMSLNDIGLGVTIERFLEKLRQSKGIQTVLKIIPYEKELPAIINLTLFRLVQEACNNVIKHANADRIIVTLQYEDNNILVEINDNGIGFDAEANNVEIYEKESDHCFGLSIMKERVDLLSGDFKVETKSGKGTKVIINVPFITKHGEDKSEI